MSRPKVDRSRMRKEDLKKETAVRLEQWQSLSPEQQLKALDERLGKGVGAVKQRARLNAKIQPAKAEPEAKAQKAEAKTKNKKPKKTTKSEE